MTYSRPSRSGVLVAQRVPAAPDVVSLFWVKNVAIMLWHQPATAAAVEGLHELAAPQRARYPTGMSFVHVGRVELARLDREAREAFVKNLRELSGYLAVTALVAQANGFLASTLRSVATNLLVLARIKHEVYLHERVDQLLDWLPGRHEQLTGVQLDPRELAEVLRHVERLQLGEQRLVLAG